MQRMRKTSKSSAEILRAGSWRAPFFSSYDLLTKFCNHDPEAVSRSEDIAVQKKNIIRCTLRRDYSVIKPWSFQKIRSCCLCLRLQRCVVWCTVSVHACKRHNETIISVYSAVNLCISHRSTSSSFRSLVSENFINVLTVSSLCTCYFNSNSSCAMFINFKNSVWNSLKFSK